MNPNDEQESIEKIYKSIIQEELDRPEVKEAKRAFIEENFPEEAAPLFGLRPVVFAPALALMMIAVLFGYPFVQKQVQKQPIPAKIASKSASVQVLPKEIVPTIGEPTEVESASSQVGSVMVYQRMHQEVPITIVWVFTPQGF